MDSILDQIFRPIQHFPQCLKSVRVIAFAFFLDGCVRKPSHRRTQTFDRLVSEAEGFRQSMFQNLAFRINGLLSRRRNLRFAQVRQKGSYPLEYVPGTQSALL
jgi:hypothetical protein